MVDKYLYSGELKELISDNPPLSMFFKLQKYLYAEIKDEGIINNEVIDINLEKLDNTQILRILTSIKIMNKDYFKICFKSIFNKLCDSVDRMNVLQKSLLLRNIADYFILVNEKEQIELGIFEPFEAIDIYDYMKNTYKKYQYIPTVEVSQEDIEKLIQLNDELLRKKVASVINGVNQVILDRESKKPHGSFEISDMEVPSDYKGKRIFLCMPFKSGQEIKSKTVPVEVAYQIIRPFVEFKKCVVVFITAKKCSQNLANYIKKLQDNMNWPIGIIQERELAGLLKVNNVL